MKALPPEMQKRLTSALDTIGRMGARQVEFGWLEDDVPIEQADWWAKATFKGAVVFVEHHLDPIRALEALCEQLQAGGKCRYCGRVIAWGPSQSRTKCIWLRDPTSGQWARGCKDMIPDGSPKAIGDEVTHVDPPTTVEQGEQFAPGAPRDLPDKEPGKHRWIASAMYSLSEEEIDRANRPLVGGETPVLLDPEHLLFTAFGCYDCEKPYDEMKGKPCPA